MTNQYLCTGKYAHAHIYDTHVDAGLAEAAHRPQGQLVAGVVVGFLVGSSLGNSKMRRMWQLLRRRHELWAAGVRRRRGGTAVERAGEDGRLS
jgi:hypothetical protein